MLDTNVLLSAYRFAPEAREELLSLMERLGDRLWIPDQVALEFHRNRLDVMAGHAAAYSPTLDTITSQQESIDAELVPALRQLAKRVALPPTELERLEGIARASLSELKKNVEALRSKHGLGAILDDDPILHRLQSIFAGKVGDTMPADKYDAAKAEAERRVKDKVPPGYKDSAKIGDYLIWCQSLAEVARRKARYLLFVTSDVKEDWYRIVAGQTVSARPELIEEARAEGNARLVLQSTHTFLYHAREHLNATVSNETLRQAENKATRDETDPLTLTERHARNLRVGLSRALKAEREEYEATALALKSCGDELMQLQDLMVGIDIDPVDRKVLANEISRLRVLHRELQTRKRRAIARLAHSENALQDAVRQSRPSRVSGPASSAIGEGQTEAAGTPTVKRKGKLTPMPPAPKAGN